ncbi:MAG: hypothetical protein AAF531_25810 [Actinomycetota bacterium]
MAVKPFPHLRSRRSRLFVSAVVAALLLAACGSGDETATTDAGAAADAASDAEPTGDTDDTAGGSSSATADEDQTTTTTSSDDDQAGDAQGESDGAGTSTGTADDAGDSSDEGDTTNEGSTSTTVDPSSLLADPDDTKPVSPPTTVSQGGGDPLMDQVIGMTEAAAIDLIRSTGRAVRVESRDGEPFMLTQDFDPERLNLTVVNNTVTGVRTG